MEGISENCFNGLLIFFGNRDGYLKFKGRMISVNFKFFRKDGLWCGIPDEFFLMDDF